MMDKPFEDNKVFVLVSDIMAWSNSERKIKKEEVKQPEDGEEAADGGQPEEKKDDEPEEGNAPSEQDGDAEEGEKDSQAQEEEEEKPIEYTYFEDADFSMRVPLKDYEYIKQIEDRVMAIKKENVKVLIVCPGIIYGLSLIHI